MRGGEKVLEAICELYPRRHAVHARAGARDRCQRHHRAAADPDVVRAAAAAAGPLLPSLPAALPGRRRVFDLDGYDLVISSSHCAVKSVDPAAATPGTSATATRRCATPGISSTRTSARTRSGGGRAALLRPVMAGLARWDAATAGRVDRFLANSQYVAGRIRRYYNRGSTVVYPPVDTEFYRPDRPACNPARASSSGRVRPRALQAARRRDRGLPAGSACR